jgi:hypothetical protein
MGFGGCDPRAESGDLGGWVTTRLLFACFLFAFAEDFFFFFVFLVAVDVVFDFCSTVGM